MLILVSRVIIRNWLQHLDSTLIAALYADIPAPARLASLDSGPVALNGSSIKGAQRLRDYLFEIRGK